ncbi:MAG: FAD-binding oxidoreductase [Candidatus Dormibacteria bacterium]
MEASLNRLLIATLGPASVLEGGALLTPSSQQGVAAVLRIAREHRLPLRLTSGPGNPVQVPEGGAVLSLAQLAAIGVDPARGVVRAEAGASLAALGVALAEAGVAVPCLARAPGSGHVGALVARGQLPRRSLTGIEAVLPGGEPVMVGAPVLKDVVGYDVTALLLGSRGRLAAIVAVHLRLAPAGAAVEVAEAAGARAVDELAGAFDPDGILARN